LGACDPGSNPGTPTNEKMAFLRPFFHLSECSKRWERFERDSKPDCVFFTSLITKQKIQSGYWSCNDRNSRHLFECILGTKWSNISYMDNEIKKIINESTFKIEDGIFIYAKVSKITNTENHFMITKDKDEITVVTKEENLSKLNLLEKNKDFYRLIALNVSIPFYSVGFLAAVSQAFAKENMNILIVSTYSKDYILIMDDRIESAKLVLLKLGFKELNL
jgi:hypothetical protein